MSYDTKYRKRAIIYLQEGHTYQEKRIYTHVTQEQDDKAIEAMNKVFEKKTA